MAEDRMEAVIKATTHGKAREEEILSALMEQKGIRWARVVELAATLETITQILAAQIMPKAQMIKLLKQAHENIAFLAVMCLTQLGERFESFSKKDEAALLDLMMLFNAKMETIGMAMQTLGEGK